MTRHVSHLFFVYFNGFWFFRFEGKCWEFVRNWKSLVFFCVKNLHAIFLLFLLVLVLKVSWSIISSYIQLQCDYFSIKSTLCSHFLQFIWIPQEIYLLWHVPTIPFNSQNVIISLSILLLLFEVFFYPQKITKEKTVDYNIFPKTNKHFL